MIWKRVATLAALVLALGVAAYFLKTQGPQQAAWMPKCLLHEWTGWHCPGCGMTRATHAALQGEFAIAWRFNPLGFVLFPIAMLGSALELGGWARNQPLPWRLRVGANGGWILLGVIVTFTILRNLPAFAWLAPH